MAPTPLPLALAPAHSRADADSPARALAWVVASYQLPCRWAPRGTRRGAGSLDHLGRIPPSSDPAAAAPGAAPQGSRACAAGIPLSPGSVDRTSEWFNAG